MARNRVELTLPFGETDVNLCCPFCGQSIMDNVQLAETPCVHVAFALIEEVGHFSYVDPKLAEEAEAALESDDPIEFLSEKLGKESSVVFQITTSGVACGPVSSTTIVGFELGSRD